MSSRGWRGRLRGYNLVLELFACRRKRMVYFNGLEWERRSLDVVCEVYELGTPEKEGVGVVPIRDLRFPTDTLISILKTRREQGNSTG